MSDVIDRIRKRFKLGTEKESSMRDDFKNDFDFFAGEQWKDETKRMREGKSRPALTINKLSQIVNQIINEQRVNRPEIIISQGGEGSNKKTADVIKGLIRSIKRRSKARSVHDRAAQAAAICGRGFFRIITDYVDDTSFDQEILMKAIHDPFSVILDPSYQEIDGSDAKWAFVFEEMNKDEFKTLYPNASTDYDFDDSSVWADGDVVKIADYYEIQEEEQELVMGDKKRIVKKKVVKHWMTNGAEIIEEATVIPCKYIPIVAVHGTEYSYKGKRKIEGVVRQVKDVQRLYNSLSSSESEMVNTIPKVAFMAPKGSIIDKDKWARANTDPVAVLEYEIVKDPVSGGAAASAPQRVVAEAPIAAITAAKNQCREDFREVTGVYPNSVGGASGEVSGSAISNRIAQGQISNSHFRDNMEKSLLHAGRIIVDMIPKIYNTQRTIEIIGAANETELVRINEAQVQGQPDHFLTMGSYSVEISAGQDYKNRREEVAKTLIDMSKVWPKILEIAGDIVVKNLEIPQSEEIAERVRKIMPQEMLINDDMTPEQLRAALESSLAKIEELNGIAEALNQTIESKQVEMDGKKEIELMKIQNELRIAMEKISVEREKILFQAKKEDVEVQVTKKELE